MMTATEDKLAASQSASAEEELAAQRALVVTRKEAAVLLNVSVEGVRALERKGLLTAVKARGVAYLDLIAVRALVRQREQTELMRAAERKLQREIEQWKREDQVNEAADALRRAKQAEKERQEAQATAAEDAREEREHELQLARRLLHMEQDERREDRRRAAERHDTAMKIGATVLAVLPVAVAALIDSAGDPGVAVDVEKRLEAFLQKYCPSTEGPNAALPPQPDVSE